MDQEHDLVVLMRPRQHFQVVNMVVKTSWSAYTDRYLPNVHSVRGT